MREKAIAGVATATTPSPRCGSKRSAVRLAVTAERAGRRPQTALTLGERPSVAELVGAAVVIAGLLCGLAPRPQSQPAYGSVAPARAS